MLSAIYVSYMCTHAKTVRTCICVYMCIKNF